MKTIIKTIGELESEQLYLLCIMSTSDEHAFKCSKLGLNFAEEYPDELEQYQQANKKYNENEVELLKLREQLEDMPIEFYIDEDFEGEM